MKAIEAKNHRAIAFFGRPGFGKTYKATEMFFDSLMKTEFGIIVDPLDNVKDQEHFRRNKKNFITISSFTELKRFFLNYNKHNKNLHLLKTREVSNEEFSEMLNLVLDICHSSVPKAHILIDEIDFLENQDCKGYTKFIDEIANYARHFHFLNVYYVVRRPVTMPRIVRTMLTDIVCFSLNEFNDLKFMRETIGKEGAETISNFEVFEYYHHTIGKKKD